MLVMVGGEDAEMHRDCSERDTLVYPNRKIALARLPKRQKLVILPKLKPSSTIHITVW
jgi:hypothetical protein